MPARHLGMTAPPARVAEALVDEDDDGVRGPVGIADPAVEATVRAPALPLGEEVHLRLDAVDVAARSVRFSLR